MLLSPYSVHLFISLAEYWVIYINSPLDEAIICLAVLFWSHPSNVMDFRVSGISSEMSAAECLLAQDISQTPFPLE